MKVKRIISDVFKSQLIVEMMCEVFFLSYCNKRVRIPMS